MTTIKKPATKPAKCLKCGKVHHVRMDEAVSRLVCRCGGRLKLVK